MSKTTKILLAVGGGIIGSSCLTCILFAALGSNLAEEQQERILALREACASPSVFQQRPNTDGLAPADWECLSPEVIEARAAAIREAEEAAQRAEQERIAALRETASETMERARAQIDQSSQDNRARRCKAARDGLAPIVAELTSLNGLTPPIDGLAALHEEATSLLQTSQVLATAQEQIEAAQAAVDADYADALVAFDAYQQAQILVTSIDGAAAESFSRDIRNVSRQLRRKERSVQREADQLRRTRAYQERGLIPVTARQLHNAFQDNEVAAEDRYKNRRVAVTGIVDSVDTDMFGNAIIRLRTSNRFMSVSATIENRQDAARIRSRSEVELDCECNGAVIGMVQLGECRFL